MAEMVLRQGRDLVEVVVVVPPQLAALVLVLLVVMVAAARHQQFQEPLSHMLEVAEAPCLGRLPPAAVVLEAEELAELRVV
ncbi:MAG: hypothetical protein EBR82_47835 [Caulobacteraceae bacterium]|nr:hypothetical protein [Caulobacteraceae bacterium]